MNNPIIIKGNKIHPTSKNVKYHRKCDTCKKIYIGWGKQYCSKKCKRPPRLEKSPFWKGDNVTASTGRSRAKKMYPLKPCKICGSKKSERHHKDGNPINNSPQNIMFVCRKHHVVFDDRIEKATQARLASSRNPS